MGQDLKLLRKQLRVKRRQLSSYQQKQAEQQVLIQLRKSVPFQTSRKIGLYLHAFGEIHTHKILKLCFQHGKQVYLPMICNMNQQLVWVRVHSNQYFNQRFSHHPLGMKEPMANRGHHVSRLDLLLMPLLACDYLGTRIGMGGGFYDRTLASAQQRPYRLGLAHDFQYIQQPLLREKWDQPLDGLLTPKKFYFFKR
ncbi:5-formyltetrahydrofolate cyclo-ligase [Acinetobacter sp. IK40]|jgi:5-formyltetrahydrofolate cyclo-ligase|uniref:5-formyltetrahydrofolate cyclo-ligase n=1 Tax=Acinetobacter sp. IK40 TaxID=2928897 RepID=UPI002D1ED600|nr:5-formyltetrahydrofolate cyclo-ligase [Acinetobacter sp. IK40]MEB3792609.1 5-formyltetrahydrofolate cyclo-ligase [Acinetobacter sp. IK40]